MEWLPWLFSMLPWNRAIYRVKLITSHPNLSRDGWKSTICVYDMRRLNRHPLGSYNAAGCLSQRYWMTQRLDDGILRLLLFVRIIRLVLSLSNLVLVRIYSDSAFSVYLFGNIYPFQDRPKTSPQNSRKKKTLRLSLLVWHFQPTSFSL